MPNDQDVLSSGLSLTPDSGESGQSSELCQTAADLYQKLMNGKTEPCVTQLREIAEQSIDRDAAFVACLALSQYYSNAFGTLSNADLNRALYYAEAIKLLGSEYLDRYHSAMAVYFLSLAKSINSGQNQAQSLYDVLAQCMDHVFEALKLGYMPTAQFFTSDDVVSFVCTGWDPHHFWGVIYYAYRLLLKDPELTPLQREELDSSATALLQDVYQVLRTTEHVDSLNQRYSKEVQRARAATPPPQDAAIISKIAKLTGRLRFRPIVEKFLDRFSTLMTIVTWGPALMLSMYLPGAIFRTVFCIVAATLATLLPNLLRFFLYSDPEASLVQRLGPRGVRHAVVVAVIYLITAPMILSHIGPTSSVEGGAIFIMAFFFLTPPISVGMRTYDGIESNP